MSLFFTLADFPTFLRFIKQRPAMPIGRSRMQLVLALFFVSTVVAYAGLLGFAAWQALGPSGQILTADASGVTVTVQQWIVLGLTFIGLSFDSVRAAASNYGAGLSAVHAYLRGTSNNANRLRGPLQHKLDEMRGDDSVDSVTLIAYSFGAIVAIDNLFPITAPPAHSYEKVKNLVTIGAAYDFVIAARSNYFDGRKAALGVPDRWLNFFAPIDLLGSDFTTPIQATVSELGSAIQVDHSTDAKAQEQAVKEIRPSNYRYDTGVELTWRRVIELYGFSAHRAYWDHDWDNDTNVFTWAVW